MSAVCFYFKIHQPFRLKRYRFFDIGNDHYYYDDFANDEIITRIAQRAYLPANELLLQMIQDSGKKFKCAFSITGTAIEQLQQFVPEFIDSMKKLVDTGCVEFGGGILPKLIRAFCDFPYIDQETYAATLTELQEAFYYFKGEAQERFTDDELIEFMAAVFNGRAQGSSEYLICTSLEALCRYARGGFDEHDADGIGDLF